MGNITLKVIDHAKYLTRALYMSTMIYGSHDQNQSNTIHKVVRRKC